MQAPPPCKKAHLSKVRLRNLIKSELMLVQLPSSDKGEECIVGLRRTGSHRIKVSALCYGAMHTS